MNFFQLSPKWIFAISTVLAIFLLWSGFQDLPDGKFHYFVLDVGQGDATLAVTPDGYRILADGGPGERILPQLKDKLPFFDHSFDLLILTHAHADHLSGFLSILDRYRVKAVLSTGALADNPAYEIFWQKVRTQKIPVYFATSAQDFIFVDGTKIDILFPLKNIAGADFKDANETSIIAKIIIPPEGAMASSRFREQGSVLITGDAPQENELAVLHTPADVSADILKVGHHGSRTSSSLEFLHEVHPEFATISVGAGNTYGHPHVETLSKLDPKTLFRTDKNGQISFNTTGYGGWKPQTYK
jgi:competence protein ComEC